MPRKKETAVAGDELYFDAERRDLRQTIRKVANEKDGMLAVWSPTATETYRESVC